MKKKLSKILIPGIILVLLATSAFTIYLQQSKRIPSPSSYEYGNRDNRQQPEKVMDAIGLQEGMVVGEAGAGGGYFTVKLARRVGDSGKVYANDIEESYLEYIRNRCRDEGLNNVVTILGEEESPLFPEGELDLAIMVHVFHHLSNPVEFLQNIKPSLKPGATLVLVEQDNDKGVSRSHSTKVSEAREMAEQAGYEMVRLENFLDRDFIMILKPIEPNE